MKRVMIKAYTAFNLGDDLFIRVLCERYPNTKFILFGPSEYKVSFKNIGNIKIISTSSIIPRVINLFLRNMKLNFTFKDLLFIISDLGVYIGGSIFMQKGNWNRTFSKLEKYKKKPFYIIGANFGPYKDKEFYLKYKNLFKEYTDICFRDKYSYNLFKNLGNVRLASDVIFQLDTKKVQIHDPKKYIVISVIKPSIRKHLIGYDKVYYEKIKDITTYFIDRGYQVMLMSFCEEEKDQKAIDSIIDIIPEDYHNELSKYLYKTNIDEALEIIANSKFIVGTRFHAMILGWVFEKPVFPIAYSNKMINVMEDIEFQGFYTDFYNIHKLKPEQVYNSMKTNLIDVSEQVENAKRQFKKLDEHLLKK